MSAAGGPLLPAPALPGSEVEGSSRPPAFAFFFVSADAISLLWPASLVQPASYGELSPSAQILSPSFDSMDVESHLGSELQIPSQRPGSLTR
jgi:hypothetical protein